MNKGLKVAAFKSGPDYIDPMFHSKVIGAKSRNLDVFMLGKETVKFLAAKNACDVNVSVFEESKMEVAVIVTDAPIVASCAIVAI